MVAAAESHFLLEIFTEICFTLFVMPRCLSAEELLDVFNSLDGNGDGVVSRQELTTRLVRVGVSMTRVEEVMHQLDMNNDGFITLEEYKTALGLTKEPTAEWTYFGV
ncbi:unnamed protein product [Heterobilharzia americana]|nr:unnamed protein product [Heterobilharzia americana]